MADKAQAKVTGHGIDGAPEGGPVVPGADVDRVEHVHRHADGQQRHWLTEPLGVETRPAMMDNAAYERPWPPEPYNTGQHGVILPPVHASEGDQQHQMVYPTAPMVRREPGSWAEPLMREGGPTPPGGEPIPGMM